MLSVLRRVIVSNALPGKWKDDQQRASRVLHEFSMVEFDSAWQYYNAISYVDDAEIAQDLFENMLEEMEHSYAFKRQAIALDPSLRFVADKARTPLVTSKEDLHYFFAYAYESERSICSQFETYSEATKMYPMVSKVFSDIAIEEKEHEQDARNALIKTLGSESRLKLIVARVKVLRFLTEFEKQTSHIGEFGFSVILSAIYYLFGGLLALTRKSSALEVVR